MTRFLSKQVFMRGAKLFVLTLVIAAYAASASATSITYVFTGTADGTLVGDGTTPFTGALMTVTATGNTDDVTFSSGTYTDSILTTTITIQGIGTMTVTPGTGNHDYVFDNQTDQKIGYGVTGILHCCDIIQLVNPAYASYNLQSSIGPLSSPADLSTADWVNVPTDLGNLTVTSYINNTFTATSTSTSSTQTLQPGQTSVYPTGADNIKFTPSNNQGGEQLTVTPVPVPQSAFVAPIGFPGETCVPYGDFSEAAGVPTCVEFQADCAQGTAGTNDCTTFAYQVATNYDLPSDLNGIGAIGGPDFLVFHGQSCPPPANAIAQSIFLKYEVNRSDPKTTGGGSGLTCFVATYTPGAPLITGAGTTVSKSQFVGFQSPVSDTDVNLIKAGSTAPLKFQVFDTSGNAISNLTYCASAQGTGCTGNWVNLSLFPMVCATDTSPVTISDTSVTTNSGFQNLGGGSYQYNWKTVKGTKGCVNVRATFSFGLVLAPAQLGFKYQ